MKGPGREERAIIKLAKAARGRADELQARLADLEAAKAATEASLEWLANAIQSEEKVLGASPQALAEFARYLEGSDIKKASLIRTRDQLGLEIVSAREMLQEGFAELKKLEHLLEIRRRAAAREAARADAARSGGPATMGKQN
jgi:hypothetical protein